MKIADAQLKQIYAHAKKTYPHECCGFLLGSFDDGGLVRRVCPTANQSSDRPDHFLISGEEFAQSHFAAEEAGLKIIGLYHSHPDWPPLPSQTDIDDAWDEVYHLIVSVHKGRPLNTNVWRFIGEGLRRFEWVALEIVDENAL